MADDFSYRLEVTDSATWRVLDSLAQGFHDGVLRQACIDTGEFVDHERGVASRFPVRLRVIVQLQNGPIPAIELTFSGVRHLVFDVARDVEPAQFEPEPNGFAVQLLGLSVAASRLRARLLDSDALGPVTVAPIDPANPG
jgi:hypothetical protein